MKAFRLQLEPKAGNCRRSPVIVDLTDPFLDRHPRQQIINSLLDRQFGIKIHGQLLAPMLRPCLYL